MKNNKGFAGIGILLAIIAVLVIGGGAYYMGKSSTDENKKVADKKIEKIKDNNIPDQKTEKNYIKVDNSNPVVLANNQFTFDIYSKINEKGKNIFFSPLSISSAFAMVYEGANGKTAEEIQSVFHFPMDINVLRNSFLSINNEINKDSNEYKLSIANALWAQKDYKFLDQYIASVSKYYDAKATNVDFINATEEARLTINKWVEDKTNNKIKDLLSKGMLSSYTRLVLTNAVYFKGQWVKSFDKKLTLEQDFTLDTNSKVKVQMMKRTDKDSVYKYGETDKLQMLEMLYKGNKISMLVLLPKDNDTTSIEKSFSIEKINEWKNILKEQRVNVFFPKFKLETEYSLAETLGRMGMPTPFSGSADFSGMNGGKDLSISSVIHKAFVDVNEEGTEAAAATAVVMGAGPGGPTIPEFRADHPFLFIIQDTTNGNILFMGRVINPNK